VYWNRIVAETEREMSNLDNALAVLRAIRVDDEHPELMMVQAQVEMYVGQLHGYYNFDAAAHQALVYDNATEHAKFHNLAVKYKDGLEVVDEKLSLALRTLSEQCPDQYDMLELPKLQTAEFESSGPAY
jgi:hypothetical protein